ncbi:MAG: hypothetical protein JWP97_4508 [Labilithrix sp.]|nr:hypothetical protein [Labilithrix sp.]
MADDDRRTLILHVAARLFGHYGPAKTTIADIAREANIGIGTVYLVFPSKEAIVEELSSSAHGRVLAAMRRVAEGRSGSTSLERLAKMLEVRTATFLELGREGQHACELLHCKGGSKGGVSPVKMVHERFREEERALIGSVLTSAQASGELAAGVKPERAAGLLQRAFATLSPPWLYDQPPEESARTTREMSRMLLSGLCARAPATDPQISRNAPRRS